MASSRASVNAASAAAEAQPELADEVRPFWLAGREQQRGAAEEVRRRPGIRPRPRTDPGRCQYATGAPREADDTQVARVEFMEVAMCLLEVVADDLIRCPASLLEPGAEALVQLRPCVLRRPGVGDVADQDMMEAVRVVIAAAYRTYEAAADKRPDRKVESGELFRRRKRDQPAAREVSARDGGALGQHPLGRVETLESAGE